MGGLSFRENRRRKRINLEALRTAAAWIFQIALVVGIAVFLVVFFGKKITVAGNAMNPGIESGDELFVNRLSYTLTTPKRGDLIVFKPNGNENSHYYVRRVAAVPGDTVQITDGKLVILDSDGKNVTVEGIDMETEIAYAGLAENAIEIPEDEYFVLGDSPDLSEDSRYADMGNVKMDYIEGKVWFKWKSKMGFIK